MCVQGVCCHCAMSKLGWLLEQEGTLCVCKESVVTVECQRLVSRNLGEYAIRSFKGAFGDQQGCLGTSKIIFTL